MSGSDRRGAGARRLLLVAAALAAATLGLWWFRSGGGPLGSAAAPLPQERPPAAVAAPGPGTGRRPLSPNGEEPSPVADDLNSPRTDIHADLRIVNELFDQYRSATHGLNPIGDNRDVTAALAGRNRLGFAFLPPDHPAINAAGELVDRWGTPFFFHQLAGDQMQIRSAGPDRKLYTDDDEVLTPGLAPPHL